MNYREFNILNTLLIAEPRKVLPPLYSPRDEICHPRKLFKIINRRHWDGVYTHNNRRFNYINISWKKQYSKNIQSSDFYVLSNYLIMFNTIHKNTNWIQWLRFWGLKPFLVTAPIFESNGTRYISKFTYPESIFDIGYSEELEKLISSRSYTIANGYILFLALFRIGYIREEIVIEALKECYNNNYYQEVHYEWQDLYYGHDIPHIADFPWYYGTSELTENILTHLMPQRSGFNFVLSINNYNITPTFQSTMFPIFNSNLWDKWDHEKWLTDYTNIIPDIPGFIQSIIKNKTSWNWWNLNKAEYLQRLDNYYNEIFIYIFYKLKDSIKYSHQNRLRHLYKDILHNCNSDRLRLFLVKYLLKVRIHDLLDNRYSYYHVFRIPSEFLLNCMKIHNTRLCIFDDIIYKSISTPVNLLIANDTIEWTDINLYKFILLNSEVKEKIEKRILTRLLYIYRYFGLFKNSQERSYVGVLLLEYLKTQKEVLIF